MINTCPKRQCRGWKTHTRVRHYTPNWLYHACWVVRIWLWEARR